jgi:hypothetical protein
MLQNIPITPCGKRDSTLIRSPVVWTSKSAARNTKKANAAKSVPIDSARHKKS